MTDSELDLIFTYGRLNDRQRLDCEVLFGAAYKFAELINKLPESREKSLALTKLQECLLWADACIAIRSKE